MQAVILAAGQSSRFWPLNKQHKSLFKIKGYPLICHTINSLKKYGVKNIIIVQAKKRDIEKELKNYDLKTDIQYVIQPEPKGTGDALFRAKKIVKDDFIILVGPHKIDLENHISLLLKKFNANKNKIVLLGAKTTKPWNFGILRFKGKKIEKIEENPGKGKDLLAVKATETYILPVGFFDYYKKVKKREASLIDAINLFIKDKGADIVLLKEDAASLKYPWEILNANQYLLRGIKDDIKGIIEKGCNITGPLIVGKGTVLKSGTYIKGPVYIGENCQIGPNCFIRNFVNIGNNCRIGNAVEIKNSVISDNSKISHLSYIGDSVVGENCNLGAGVIAANVRFDKKTIFSEVKGELINTEREKLGCILGNDVHVGVNTSLMPGVLIGSGCQIGPNSLVRRNVKENTIFYTKAVDVKKKLSQNGKIL